MLKNRILLLNGSNYGRNLVYPYAFVQVTEVASRYKIDVVRKDLFEKTELESRDELTELLNQNLFDAIFITLRNSDSLDIDKYPPEVKNDEARLQLYFPIVTTKKIIKIIKTITDLPIVVGGFGFSILPEKIIRYLDVEFGVFGGPEGILANLDVLYSKTGIENIPNLYYYTNNTIIRGPRVFHPPSENPEYTVELINEIKVFHSIFEDRDDVELVKYIAIEISRGCPHRCSFCSEPIVKGNELHFRNIDAIMEDLKLLHDHGFWDIFFVCSELNPINNNFPIELANQIRELNSAYPSNQQIKWKATYMMNMNNEEFIQLKNGGFDGGWYDIITLEDNNLRANFAPYNSIKILNTIKNLDGALHGSFIQEDKILDFTERILKNKPKSHSGSFFLGNPHTTIETIRKTLEKADEFELHNIYDKTGINYATRIFDYQNLDLSVLQYCYSINFDGEITEYDDLFPSFTYPAVLMKYFGQVENIRDFFDYLSNTFLSSEFIFNINWFEFLTNLISIIEFLQFWSEIDETTIKNSGINEEIRNFLLNLDDTKIRSIYSNLVEENEVKLISIAINHAIKFIIIHNNDRLVELLEILTLPLEVEKTLNLSSYQIMKALYSHDKSLDYLINLFNEKTTKGIERLFLQYLLKFKNLRLESILHPFFSSN